MDTSLCLEHTDPESNFHRILLPKIKWTHMAEVLHNTEHLLMSL